MASSFKPTVEMHRLALTLKQRIIRNRLRPDFANAIRHKKPWANAALDYGAMFAVAVETSLRDYKIAAVTIIETIQLPTLEKDADQRTYDRIMSDESKGRLDVLRTMHEGSLLSAYKQYISDGLAPATAELAFQSWGLDFNFGKFDRRTNAYLNRKAIEWSKQVSETTEAAVKRELVSGYEAGIGSYDIARNLESSTDFSYSRAEAVARTETMGAANYADYTASLDNPNVQGHEWSADGDDRTRLTHIMADGQKRKKGEHFDVGGYPMLYPHDPKAPADQVIQCRCILLDVFIGEDITSHTIYDEPDAHTLEWLARQSDDFQTEYWGGETKRLLGDAGLIDIAERDLPLMVILANLRVLDDEGKTDRKKLRRLLDEEDDED